MGSPAGVERLVHHEFEIAFAPSGDHAVCLATGGRAVAFGVFGVPPDRRCGDDTGTRGPVCAGWVSDGWMGEVTEAVAEGATPYDALGEVVATRRVASCVGRIDLDEGRVALVGDTITLLQSGTRRTLRPIAVGTAIDERGATHREIRSPIASRGVIAVAAGFEPAADGSMSGAVDVVDLARRLGPDVAGRPQAAVVVRRR